MKNRRCLVFFLLLILLFSYTFKESFYSSSLKHVEKYFVKYLPNENLKSKRHKTWKNFKEGTVSDENKCDLVFDLFQPLNAEHFTRKKKTVVLGIGAHHGFVADLISTIPRGDMEYISWYHLHKNLEPAGGVKLLTKPYSKNILKLAQSTFWRVFQHDTDLMRADIILCGFDAWHCLIFAPFNKKLLINNAYRFDGHIKIDRENAMELQEVLYNAVRYNPDVILASAIIYDVMYEQHFLGSHKIIPLLATCEYVHERLREELKKGKCNMSNALGYHPVKNNFISIFPRRLSPGGMKVAFDIIKFSNETKSGFDMHLFERDEKSFKYCQLGRFSAVIILAYSVMSYFTCEVASLGIPMFVPTPRLYAQWEKLFHLIPERKNNLKHGVVDDMTQNKRSLNKGYNPNDDFNEESLKRWLGYSEYYYYKGVILFDSLEDLFEKLKTADFAKMNKDSMKHRVENNVRSYLNLKAINKYFFNDENGHQQKQANSLSEGLDTWQKQTSKPKFNPVHKQQTKSHHENQADIIIINYDEYISEFKTNPKCAKQLEGVQIIYYTFNENAKPREFENSLCLFKYVSSNELKEIPQVQEVLQIYPAIFSDKYVQLLIMLIYALQNGASTVVRLHPNEKFNDKLCEIPPRYEPLLPDSNGWSYTIFSGVELVFAWVPVPTKTLAFTWLETVLKFTTKTHDINCMNYKQSYNISENDAFRLKDYLHYWISDEEESYYNMLDQLNFELAVRGYTTKCYAQLHRLWMEILASHNYTKQLHTDDGF